MVWKERYGRAKARLAAEAGICAANRRLFANYLQDQEYVLKRTRGNATLDENSYKTLMTAISRLRTVNRWLRNKRWDRLTKRDVQRLYDDLEDGRITTRRGKPLRDKTTYYRILRGKAFEMAGKRVMAQEVLKLARRHTPEEVRFIKEHDFRRLVEVSSTMEQRAFLWLCWDIGENASAILRLRKSYCVRQVNVDTKEFCLQLSLSFLNSCIDFQ